MESKEIARKIGEILSARQEELGVSLRQIEESSGVSRMSVSRILAGQPSMSADKLIDVARALKLEAWKVWKQAEEELQAENLTPAPISELPIPPQPTQEELETLLAEADTAAAARDIPKGLENLNEDWTRQDLDWPE